MLVERPDIKRRLTGIAHRLTPDSAMRDDLFQEMALHLWKLEQAKPNNTISWYLDSCKYHALNTLRRGRSIDSKYRRNVQVLYLNGGDTDDSGHGVPELASKSDFESRMILADQIAHLGKKLTRTSLAVLRLLRQGFSVAEIGQKLNVSHQCISKHRKRIAEIARQGEMDIG